MTQPSTRVSRRLQGHLRWLLPSLSVCLFAGCAPKVDQSGWEMARKKNPTERLESYPDIPVHLPASSAGPITTTTGSPMEGVRLKALDIGSLFRRGFSAPSP